MLFISYTIEKSELAVKKGGKDFCSGLCSQTEKESEREGARELRDDEEDDATRKVKQ